jgi:hypothetical protein
VADAGKYAQTLQARGAACRGTSGDQQGKSRDKASHRWTPLYDPYRRQITGTSVNPRTIPIAGKIALTYADATNSLWLAGSGFKVEDHFLSKFDGTSCG